MIHCDLIFPLILQGGFESQASEKGMDPSLVSNILGLLGKGDDGSFDMGSMISMAQMLTQGGSSGGGASGFLNLIGGGNEGSNKLFEILVGLAKSFFAMKMGSNKSLQGMIHLSEIRGLDLMTFLSEILHNLLFWNKKKIILIL